MFDDKSWQPLLLNPAVAHDQEALQALKQSNRLWSIHDTLEQQLIDLAKVRNPQWVREKVTSSQVQAAIEALTAGVALADFGRWVYYPWSGRLVHLLPPAEFHILRTNRNQYKITPAEQAQLAQATVGIVGLSVGNAVALTLAVEGVGGHLKLADFDRLDLSNLNRIRAGVQEIGLPKTILAARQIFEINPYARLTLFDEGLTPENMDDFLRGPAPLDVLIDECDDLRLKLLLRERARALRLPVLMETSDRGQLDVERFDQEPTRPLLHGLLGDLQVHDLPAVLSNDEKMKLVLRIVAPASLSDRAAASMLEIGETLTTWPQLASEVTLGGATMTTAVRRLLLGQPLPSGRHAIDLGALLSEAPTAVVAPASQPMPTPVVSASAAPAVPDFIRHVVAHAILAPSGGNCQPWRFYYDQARLWLVHDRQRSQNSFDGQQRGTYIALGAALHNSLIAAAASGYHARITPFPVPECRAIVAALDFTPASAVASEELAVLLPTVAQRVTSRQGSTPQPFAPEQQAMLQGQTAAYGAALHWLTAGTALGELGAILGEGDRIRFLNPTLHREMMAEVRWTPASAQQSRDGLDLATLELSSSQSIALQLLARPAVAGCLRDLDAGRALALGTQKSVQNASAVGLVTVAGDDPAAILRGGQAIQQLWLQATRLGWSLQPVTAPLYLMAMVPTPDAAIFNAAELAHLTALQTRFARLCPVASTTTPLLLFRLFQAAPPTARSLRRSLDEVLFVGSPF